MPGRTGRSASPHTVEPPAVPLRRATGGGVPDEHGRLGTLRGDIRRVVDEARRGGGWPDPLVDHLDDLDDPLTPVGPRRDTVTNSHVGRRLHAGSVEPDVPATARRRRLSAGLENAHRPEPAVDPRRLHRRIVARAATSWATKRDGRCPAFDRVLPSRPGLRTGPRAARPTERTGYGPASNMMGTKERRAGEIRGDPVRHRPGGRPRQPCASRRPDRRGGRQPGTARGLVRDVRDEFSMSMARAVEAGSDEAALLVDVDSGRVDEIRPGYPFLADRR